MLINADCRACLADFGLSSLIFDISSLSNSVTGRGAGSTRWMAPELFEGDGTACCSKESDVYAFGMMCIEVCFDPGHSFLFIHEKAKVFTGKFPFHQQKTDAAVIVQVMSGVRPPRPLDDFSEVIWVSIKRCWQQECNSRPKMSELLPLFKTASQGVETVPFIPRPSIHSIALDHDSDIFNFCTCSLFWS